MSTLAKWIIAFALVIIVGLAIASVLQLRATQSKVAAGEHHDI